MVNERNSSLCVLLFITVLEDGDSLFEVISFNELS